MPDCRPRSGMKGSSANGFAHSIHPSELLPQILRCRSMSPAPKRMPKTEIDSHGQPWIINVKNHWGRCRSFLSEEPLRPASGHCSLLIRAPKMAVSHTNIFKTSCQHVPITNKIQEKAGKAWDRNEKGQTAFYIEHHIGAFLHSYRNCGLSRELLPHPLRTSEVPVPRWVQG